MDRNHEAVHCLSVTVIHEGIPKPGKKHINITLSLYLKAVEALTFARLLYDPYLLGFVWNSRDSDQLICQKVQFTYHEWNWNWLRFSREKLVYYDVWGSAYRWEYYLQGDSLCPCGISHMKRCKLRYYRSLQDRKEDGIVLQIIVKHFWINYFWLLLISWSIP